MSHVYVRLLGYYECGYLVYLGETFHRKVSGNYFFVVVVVQLSLSLQENRENL